MSDFDSDNECSSTGPSSEMESVADSDDEAGAARLDLLRQRLVSNDVILGAVFRHLGVLDLWDCRQVSSLWRKIAMPIFISKLDEFNFVFKGPCCCLECDNGDSASSDSESDADSSEDVSASWEFSRWSWETISEEGVKRHRRALKIAGDPTRSNFAAYVKYLQESQGQDDQIILTSITFHNIKILHPLVQTFLDQYGENIKQLSLNLETEEYDRYKNDGYFDEFWARRENDPDPHCHGKEYLDTPSLKKLLLSQCPNLEVLDLVVIPPCIGRESSPGFLESAEERKEFESGRSGAKITNIAVHHRCGFTALSTGVLRDILLISPLLKSFIVSTDYESYGVELAYLRCLVSTNRVKGLQNLKLGNPGKEALELLHSHRKEFNLRKLVSCALEVACGEFTEFIDSQKEMECLQITSTLEAFDPYEPPGGGGERPEITFPECMRNLTKLSIPLGSHYSDHTRKWNFTPISWAAQFPSLKTLTITGNGKLVELFPNSDNQIDDPPLLTLTHLRLPSSLRPGSLDAIAKLFPNVTTLLLSSQPMEEMRKVWTLWPRMKKLYLSAPTFSAAEKEDPSSLLRKWSLDSLLTGFSVEDLEVLSTGVDVDEGRRGPGIDKLQELQEFAFCHGESTNCMSRMLKDSYPCKMTGFSCWVLYKMKRLMYLNIVADSIEIGDEHLQALCYFLHCLWMRKDSDRLELFDKHERINEDEIIGSRMHREEEF